VADHLDVEIVGEPGLLPVLLGPLFQPEIGVRVPRLPHRCRDVLQPRIVDEPWVIEIGHRAARSAWAFARCGFEPNAGRSPPPSRDRTTRAAPSLAAG